MNDVVAWIVAVPIAYLIGAIPTGYLFGKVWRGVDVRRYGSGGTGFTNVMRTLGRTAALTVLAIDIAKGAIPVVIAIFLTEEELKAFRTVEDIVTLVQRDLAAVE